MNDPPDPGDIPPVGLNITITDDCMVSDSSTATDSSLRTDRKRVRSPHKICKNCNKRKKHNKHSHKNKTSGSECNCNCNLINEIRDRSPIIITHESQDIESKDSNNSKISVSTQPPQVLTRTLYESTDASPFIIHVQKETSDNTTTLHPVAFGHFLKKNCYKNIINGSLKRIGRNRITISFNKFEDANLFISDPSLTKHNFKAYIPSFSITRMGLVRGVPTEWTVEDIIENVSVPIGCGKVIKARRFNYKVHGTTPVWKPSQTVVLTFDGQVLPKRVFLCYNALSVELYTFPTIQCFNCCRFGHTKLQCKSSPRCYKCGQNHTADTCDLEEDCAKCFLCGGFHFAISKSCQELERQKRIKVYMAQNSVSYAEALKLHPPPSKSYADMLTSTSNKNSTQYDKSASSHPSSPSSPNKSYKKTIFIQPKSPPKFTRGYDRDAHQSIIKDFDGPSPSNGCALKNNDGNNNDKQMIDVILALFKSLSQTNSLPSNVASLIETFIQLINNGQSSKNSAMELQKCNK